MKNCFDIFDDCKIPSLTYINSLRLSMQNLNELQAKHFVDKSKILTLSMDESPTSSGDKGFQVGAYNEMGEYCVLTFKEIAGGTANEIHDRVIQLLQHLFQEKFVEFIKKIRFLSSDTARNQIAANKKLISTFMLSNGGTVIYMIKCSMHCISNMEKYAKNSNEILVAILNAISNGLGKRAKQGCQSGSALKIFELTKKDSDMEFMSYAQQRGCRFYNHSRNSMIYAKNYEFTNAVCAREADDVDYCKVITDVVHDNGPVKTAAIVGSLGYVWSTLIAPLWSLLSKPLKVKELKETIVTAIPVTSLETLQGFQQKMTDKHNIPHNEEFCSYFLQLLDRLNNEDRMEMEIMINQMVMNAMFKFRKDFQDILDYPADIDNVTIVPSIQRVESTFSTLRRLETVDNLAKQKVFSETMFRQNRTLDWVLQNEDYKEIITEATTSQNRLRTLDNDNKEDSEMEKVLYNRRLVLQPLLKKRKKND